MRKAVAAVVAAGLMVAVVIVVLGRRSLPAPDAPSQATCSVDAKRADFSFTLKNLDGNPVRLADYRGKVLLLDFWATWCGPCKVEIPAFVDLYDKYRSRGFEVVGVVVMDIFDRAGPFAKEWKMNYAVLDGIDQEEALDQAYGPLVGLPTSFLIARDGRICHKHLGLPASASDPEKVKDIFEAQIKELL
jgi:cytochrome c biogenesis protein CcmG/thiol:disulfide interchange protein DsbE